MATENMKRGRIDEYLSAQSSYSSPADKVLSVDDLLRGILFRLPVRSLLRFKSVSKHWYFLITSPSFKLLRSRNPEPPSGLFVPIRTDHNKRYLEYEFVSFDIAKPVKAPFRTPNFDPNVGKIEIEHSSNGLMLCSSQTSDVSTADRPVAPNQYYVYNPTINQFITLPRFENYVRYGRFGMSMAFDPSKSSDYRIIYVCGLEDNHLTGEINYQIEIFSSTTRTWKLSCQFSFNRRVYISFRGGVYWNNAIHWIGKGYLVYFKLDEEESIHVKQTPLCLVGLDAVSQNISESQDQLLLVELEVPSHNSKFKIHEMKRDYSAWSLKYHVDLEGVATKYEFVVLSVVLGEKEDDSFLVIEIPGKALRFNLATNTFHKLHDFPASRYVPRYNVYIGTPYGFQFVESLSTALDASIHPQTSQTR